MSAMCSATAVLLPGTGSDEVFVSGVFAGPLAAIGVRADTPPPPAGDRLVAGSLAQFDAAADAAGAPILAGGISFGAQLAVEWALRRPNACAGLLLALPAWNGDPGTAPAAQAALFSADRIDREGLEPALTGSTEGVPDWLATELPRAWRGHGTALTAGLRAAATHPAPTLRRLREITVPAGVAACVDDPVHPLAVAEAWTSALGRGALTRSSLAALGDDRESLGRAAVLALLRAHADTADPPS